METKVCKKCNTELPKTDKYFRKRLENIDGLSGKCKQCISSESKQWQAEHEGYRSKKYKQWSENHKDYKAEKKKIWDEANANHRLEYRNRYKEKQIKLSKIWRSNNREKLCVKSHNRRANIRKLQIGFNLKQWENAKNYFDNKCCYCGKKLPLEQEHFIAVKGQGEYTINNIIPSCRSCNGSKSSKNFFEWFPKYKYYSKKREKLILKFLNYEDNIQQLKII